MKKSLRKKYTSWSLDKRQKFILIVIILTLGLFFSEHIFGKIGFYASPVLSLLTDALFFLSIRKDMKDKLSLHVFILPFFYSLAFGLFYFLAPTRLLTRLIMAVLYAVGLYSLFLSQNIFIVASTRTIALLSSARIVSLVITLLSFFFLSNVVFSLHLFFPLEVLFIFLCSFCLVLQSLWTITLEKSLSAHWQWSLLLSLGLAESSLVLWFWPSSPTVIALFLTGLFYTLVGPSQVWLARRMFRGVMWEYLWVAVLITLVLVTFTAWGK